MRIKDKKTLSEVISNLIYISDTLDNTHYRREDRNSVTKINEAQKHLSRCIESLKSGKRVLDISTYNAQREQQRLDDEEQTNRGDN